MYVLKTLVKGYLLPYEENDQKTRKYLKAQFHGKINQFNLCSHWNNNTTTVTTTF